MYKRPTKRAPDAGDSAHIPSSFTRLSFFLAGRLRRPRHQHHILNVQEPILLFLFLLLCERLAHQQIKTLFNICIILLAFLLSSCASNKNAIAAGLPDPDTGFTTGSVTGYNVYIWECYQGKRIVIFNTSAEFTSTDYQLQEAVCEETTPIEEQLKNESKSDLDPNLFWR